MWTKTSNLTVFIKNDITLHRLCTDLNQLVKYKIILFLRENCVADKV